MAKWIIRPDCNKSCILLVKGKIEGSTLQKKQEVKTTAVKALQSITWEETPCVSDSKHSLTAKELQPSVKTDN